MLVASYAVNERMNQLMLEHLDTLAEKSAQAISNIKFDKVIVWENGGGIFSRLFGG